VKKCRWYLVPVSYYPVLGVDPASHCILRHFGKILGFSPGRLRARQLAARGDEPGAIGRDRGRDQPAGQGGARSHVDQLAIPHTAHACLVLPQSRALLSPIYKPALRLRSTPPCHIAGPDQGTRPKRPKTVTRGRTRYSTSFLQSKFFFLWGNAVRRIFHIPPSKSGSCTGTRPGKRGKRPFAIAVVLSKGDYSCSAPNPSPLYRLSV